ncbi:MAG: DUF559 domain-containing protein [Cyclobacteriaceae bacterium]
MIENRPKYLEENIKYYKEFPTGYNLDIDYNKLPPLLNLDFHTLNGILPLTKSRAEFIGENGKVDGKESTIIFTNPLPEEYEYYESIGVTEFQAIQLIINFHSLNEGKDGTLRGIPYSISLAPMEKNKQIDTWNINLLKQFDLEKLTQEGGYVYSDFNPFQGVFGGYVSHYDVFSRMTNTGYTDSIGFVWGMYFLSPIFDKKEVEMMENSTFSKQINSKYRRFKTDLYFKQFQDIRPRRIWGCDSPIELFLLQGLGIRELYPEIQMCFYKNGEMFKNYSQMQENEVWIGQEQLITAADFYFPDRRLAIFCDGKEYHDSAKDKEIDSKLSNLGISVLRFNGHQINNDLPTVLDEIEKKVK